MGTKTKCQTVEKGKAGWGGTKTTNLNFEKQEKNWGVTKEGESRFAHFLKKPDVARKLLGEQLDKRVQWGSKLS